MLFGQSHFDDTRTRSLHLEERYRRDLLVWFFLELAIGQYGGLGPNKLFGRLAPAFKGLGYGMLFVSFLVVIYYNMIMAWILVYTVAGMQAELPWNSCGNDYNSLTCYNKDLAAECSNGTGGLLTYWNNSCTSIDQICTYYNLTHNPNQTDYRNLTTCMNSTSTATLTLDQVEEI